MGFDADFSRLVKRRSPSDIRHRRKFTSVFKINKCRIDPEFRNDVGKFRTDVGRRKTNLPTPGVTVNDNPFRLIRFP